MEINLDRNTWKVEQGDPSSLIFSTPEEAEEFRDEQRAQMRRFTKRQIESGEVDIAEDPSPIGAIEDPRFNTKQTLPEGLQFAFVYTPQYGEDGVEPNNDLPDDPEDEAIAHIHVFPDGTAEHTVIQIVEVDDSDVGYSLEMEPMGGTVRFLSDIIDPRESLYLGYQMRGLIFDDDAGIKQGPSRSPWSRRGFNLIEITIALAILVLALAILVENQGFAAYMTRDAERIRIATMLAEENSLKRNSS